MLDNHRFKDTNNFGMAVLFGTHHAFTAVANCMFHGVSKLPSSHTRATHEEKIIAPRDMLREKSLSGHLLRCEGHLTLIVFHIDTNNPNI